MPPQLAASNVETESPSLARSPDIAKMSYGMNHPLTMLTGAILLNEPNEVHTPWALSEKLVEAQGAEPLYPESLGNVVAQYCEYGLVRAGLAFQTSTRGRRRRSEPVVAFGATENLSDLGAACFGVVLDLELGGDFSSQKLFGRSQLPSPKNMMNNSLLRFAIAEDLWRKQGDPGNVSDLVELTGCSLTAVSKALTKLQAAKVLTIYRRADGDRFVQAIAGRRYYLPKTAIMLSDAYRPVVGVLVNNLADVQADPNFRDMAKQRLQHILSNPYAVNYLVASALAQATNLRRDPQATRATARQAYQSVEGWISLREEVGNDKHWHSRAVCANGDVDPDALFPLDENNNEAVGVLAAKAICQRCPVQVGCLDLALGAGMDYGILANRTPNERRRTSPGVRLLLRSLELNGAHYAANRV